MGSRTDPSAVAQAFVFTIASMTTLHPYVRYPKYLNLRSSSVELSGLHVQSESV